MPRHTWDGLLGDKFTPEELAKIDRQVEQEILRMNLRSLRKVIGMSQQQMAKVTMIDQAELSRMERRRDHRLSTLNRYITTLGGRLEIRAVFPDKVVELLET